MSTEFVKITAACPCNSVCPQNWWIFQQRVLYCIDLILYFKKANWNTVIQKTNLLNVNRLSELQNCLQSWTKLFQTCYISKYSRKIILNFECVQQSSKHFGFKLDFNRGQCKDSALTKNQSGLNLPRFFAYCVGEQKSAANSKLIYLLVVYLRSRSIQEVDLIS